MIQSLKSLSILSTACAAFALGGESVEKQRLADMDGTLEDLEVMRRVLVSEFRDWRKDGEASGLFRSDASKDSGGGFDSFNSAKSVFSRYLDASGRAIYTSDFDSRADYVPGFGAVFSMTVPIDTVVVDLEEEGGKKGSTEADVKAKKSKWEDMQEKVRGQQKTENAAALNAFFYGDMAGQKQAKNCEMRYAKESLDQLEKVLISALEECGHKVRVGDAENLAICVKLVPGPSGERPKSEQPQGKVLDYTGDPVAEATLFYQGWRTGAANCKFQKDAPRQLSIVVPVRVLRQHDSGDLSTEQLMSKMRLSYL